MNVLVINGTTDLYGANRILLQVMKILAPRKVILVVPAEGPMTDIIKQQADYAHVTVLFYPRLPLAARSLGSASGVWDIYRKMRHFRRFVKSVAREHPIQWVYVNTLSCFIVLRVLKSLGLKSFLHVHEILENDRMVTRKINQFALAWSDFVVTVSDPVRDNLLEAAKGYSDKVVTVFNGIEDRKKDFIGLPDDKGIVVTLFGRIKPEKGAWYFLDAISLLPAEVSAKCQFRIFGGPAPNGEGWVEKLRADIRGHVAGRSIVYDSFIEDTSYELNRSDVIVVPSLMKDPFPTTVLEGLSAGKPVIATNTGGSKQAMVDGETGYLIGPEDKIRFAECLERLITDGDLRHAMGAKARSRFLECFTLDIFRNNLIREIDSFETTLSQPSKN